jgi:hypothetical protein
MDPTPRVWFHAFKENRTFEIEFLDAGVEAFAFTFG